MDEVGFMVTKITDKGFLEFQTLGGWWGQVMLAQQVEMKTQEGKSHPWRDWFKTTTCFDSRSSEQAL